MFPLPVWLTSRVFGYIVAVAVVLGILAWTHHTIYQSGYQACEAKYQVAMAESIKKAGEEARAIALEDAAVMRSSDKARIQRQIVYRDRQIEVIKHVQADCSLDAAGLGLLNDALSDAPTKAPSTRKFSPTLHSIAATP